MAVISLSSAQLAFGHVALLDHAEFSIETGERVGVIGRNGTGKSSLLKTIAGRFKLDDGLLDLVVIEKAPLVQTIPNVPRLYSGDYLKLPFVQFSREKVVYVSAPDDEQVPLDADGDTVGYLPATFEIIPLAVRFKVM